MEESVELFAPGSLGTCWYGKYHYLEPWIGCQHDCPYCYAKSRRAVNCTLKKLRAKFADPVLLYPEEELLRRIYEESNSGSINILKLSRYTDIFTPKFVANGLSLEILKILCSSKIKRIIITTKGLPSNEIINLITGCPEKFSYNAAFSPSALLSPNPLAKLSSNLQPLQPRLEAAEEISRSKCLTTIHLDPFIAQIDDRNEALHPFLDLLEKHNLNRVMWSYLLFSPGIMDNMRQALSPEVLNAILSRYNFDADRRILPGQDDTDSFAQKDEVALASVEKVAGTLMQRSFKFVLCSLKSIKGLDLKKYPRQMLCDGKFYA
ncbi:MAG: hypothetical protein ACI38Q_06195 [Candidatus Bruticola sp.]